MIVSKLLGAGTKFLSSKLVTVVLLAALASVGSYVAYIIKDRGALEVRVEQERANAEAWAAYVDNIQALERRFDAFDQELAAARRDRQELARTVDREIEGLRREIPDVDAFLSRRAPAELVRVLCDDGTIAPTAPECTDDP